ncbi:MAG: CDP-alcohol phosphatidyltransferase family protein [Chloroflexi bacterium]|nr:MAG: CDP-alcohol phosphatidyltransferase family protein [Chloroflexota bacterium]
MKKERPTFTDLMRVRFKGVLDPIGKFFNRLGLAPNTMTILGLVGNAVGAYFLSQGQLALGGFLILLMGPVDALDGTMARLRGEASDFGAFVDSVTDRYSELVIFLGLLLFYTREDNWWAAGLTYLAAAGSVLVSYVRARGHSLGYDTKVGLLTRLERYMVLAPALLLSGVEIVDLPLIGIGIIAFFANLTALQRILDVRRQAYVKKNSHKQ